MEKLGRIAGESVAGWARKSSELSAHQISVGGSVGGFLRAERSSNGLSELSGEFDLQSW